MSTAWGASEGPLSTSYDVALLDLDGVVYIGRDAVPAAPDALGAARRQGMQLAFVTNNAARPPAVVAQHLTELGIDASEHEVITSSQAAARYLADRVDPGAKVLVLGTTGLYEALRERGLHPVDHDANDVVAVVQGYSPDMNWRLLAEGAVAVNRGVLWVATNADPTVPSARGPLPGNGSLVAALRLATQQDPVVTGKPDPTMHRETMIRTGARRPIVVGDRLDTDIEGANAVGCDSLLVLSGVTTARELLQAEPRHRPTYLAADVAGLLTGSPMVRVADATATCNAWTATVEGDRLALRSTDDTDAGNDAVGDDADSALDALRALSAIAWHTDDAAGRSDVDASSVRQWAPCPADAAAREALAALRLT